MAQSSLLLFSGNAAVKPGKRRGQVLEYVVAALVCVAVFTSFLYRYLPMATGRAPREVFSSNSLTPMHVMFSARERQQYFAGLTMDMTTLACAELCLKSRGVPD